MFSSSSSTTESDKRKQKRPGHKEAQKGLATKRHKMHKMHKKGFLSSFCALCNFYLANLAPRLFGHPTPIPWMDSPATKLLGIRSFAFGLTQQIFGALLQSFILLFFLLLLYILLRRERLAVLALTLIMAVALSLTHDNATGIPFACIAVLFISWVLYRYGLLALISAIFFVHLTIFYPITSDLSAWYAADFVMGMIVCLVLVVFGFYTSLAGQPLFRSSLLSDNS